MLDTPAASIDGWVIVNVAVYVTASPIFKVGSVGKVVDVSVELTYAGGESNDKLAPPIAVSVSVMSIPVSAVLPVLVTTIV